MNKQTAGFTIVELVTVIMIIGILSVVVLPKFSGKDSFEPYAFRTQLISALRLTQQRAMQQTSATDNYCHQLVIDDDRYGIPNRKDCTNTDLSGLDVNDLALTDAVLTGSSVTLSVEGMTNPSSISFDSMGRPPAVTRFRTICSDGYFISITNTEETVRICIESEGYIHAI